MQVETVCGDTMYKISHWVPVVISSENGTGGYNSTFQYALIVLRNNQIILIETSSCNLQIFSELITTQLEIFHVVSPQTVFT